MHLASSPTELTTAASDAVLAALCLAVLLLLARTPGGARLRRRLWAGVYAVLAAASALGSFAHGFELSVQARTWLWRPLYLLLGLCVAMFFVAGVNDLRGERAARAVLPWVIASALGFFVVTQISDDFRLFVAYEAVAMIATLVMYTSLSLGRRLAGAATIAIGVALNLVAAVIQVSSVAVTILWPFDHNGVFHLVQMVAVVVIAMGLRAGMRADVRLAGAL